VRRTSQQAVAEFIATFTLIFIGAGSSILYVAKQVDLVGVALAHGLALAIMVSVTAHISGGHVNPAVTAGLWVTGKIQTVRAGIYVCAQLLGAALGAAALRWTFPEAMWRPANLGTPVPASFISGGAAVVIEAILTFFLVFVVYGTAVDEHGPFAKLAGWPIGFVLTMDILAAGPLTGAAMNPARAFGPALISGTWTDWWVYWVGPVTGGIIAGAVYWATFLKDREPVLPD
jgi:MIP family channel proteins